MSKQYRVVLTCWDADEPKPYADDFSGVKLSLFPTMEAAQAAIDSQVKDELTSLNDLETDSPREKMPIEDSDGKVVGYDYPFRGDFDSGHTGIVRLWEGDDYRNVTAYDIYPMTCDHDDPDKCSYFKYRGFWILPNEAHTRFNVEQFDTRLLQCQSLQEALRDVDCLHCELEYAKPSMITRLAQVAISSKERETEKAPSLTQPARPSLDERILFAQSRTEEKTGATTKEQTMTK